MRRAPVGPLALVIALTAGILSPATAHASGSFSARSTTLSAQQIVSRMNTAAGKASSVHIAVQLNASESGVLDLSLQLAGDASMHPLRIMEAGTIHAASSGGAQTLPQSTHVQLMAVGGLGAWRRGDEPWKCASVKSILGQFLDLRKTINPRIQATRVADTETVDGVSVWHIKGMETAVLGNAVPSLLSTSIEAPVDLYISRSDFLLVRSSTTLTARTSSGVLHETVTADLSRYGEQVHVTLPGECGVPLLFSIQRLALEKPNAKPDYALKRPSPARVPRGRQIQLAVYFGYNTVRTRTTVHECEQVWRGGTRVFTSCDHDSVSPSDQGGQEVFTDTFTPQHTGHFRFTVIAWSGPQRISKSAWFWVSS